MQSVDRFKVCFLTSGHRVDAARLLNEARSLTKAGWRVSILGVLKDDSLESLPYDQVVHIQGTRLRRLISLWRHGVRQRCTVYHAHELDSLLIAVLLSRCCRAHAVYDCHEYQAEAVTWHRFRVAWVRRLAARLVDRVEKSLARRCHLVVTVNDHLGETFRRCGCRTVTLPNYPLLSVMDSASGDPRVAKDYAGNEVLVYVGQLSPERGIDVLIEVASKLVVQRPQIRLLLVGRAYSSVYQLELNQRIVSLGLQRVVHMVGQIPHHHIRSYLAVGDIGIFLLQPVSERYNHGEPIKMFEYAAAGLPTIVSDLPAKRRLIEDMMNGRLVPPTDVAEVSDAIARLLDDREMRDEMAQNGRDAFLTKYNWEQVESRLVSAYEEMTNRP